MNEAEYQSQLAALRSEWGSVSVDPDMPGILRAKLIEEGKAEEAELTPADLGEGFYIGNVIRGLIPARTD